MHEFFLEDEMKKMYAGGWFEIVLIFGPLFGIFLYVLAGVILFCNYGFNEAVLIIAIAVFLMFCLSGILIWYGRILFLTWITFHDEYLIIKTLFRKAVIMRYDEIAGCGIGYYFHGRMISGIGIMQYYIFLSNGEFDDSLRKTINRWRPKKQKYVKIAFSQKKYDYILTKLPKNLSTIIRYDHDRFIPR